MKNNLLILLTIIGLACSKKEDPKPTPAPVPTPVPIVKDTIPRQKFHLYIEPGTYVSKNTLLVAPATYETYHDTVHFHQDDYYAFLKGRIMNKTFDFKVDKKIFAGPNINYGFVFDSVMNDKNVILGYYQGKFTYFDNHVVVKDSQNKWMTTKYISKFEKI